MLVNVKLTRSENADYHHMEVGKVLTIDIEEYLRGVVPSEVDASRGMEALKAQAIAARTYGIFHGAGKKEIADTTANQSYHAKKIHNRTDEAIRATAGIVLTYNNKIIDAVFSASNGGRCVSAKERWGNDVPYLIARDDPWTKATGVAKDGHGVGLSQFGDYYAAEQLNKSYETILEFYYPGTVLRPNYNESSSSSPSTDVVNKTGTVVVNSAGLNVRNSPNGSLLSYKLYNGETVTILEVQTGGGYTWYRVKDSQGRTNGWVRADFITINSGSGSGSSSGYATWQDKYGDNTFVNSNSYSGNVYRFQVDLNKWLTANKQSTIAEDGKWGSGSSAATLKFQQAYSDLDNDGKAGPKTKQKLFSLYG